MKKAARVIAYSTLALALAAAGAFAIAVGLGERKMARTVDVKVVPVPFVNDAGSLKLGRYLFEARGCAECHAADGHGLVFIDEPNGLFVKSPNITSRLGGVVAGYTEGDWVRAIRHGVNPQGHALLVMPSEDYNRMSDADFTALVAYVRSLPPMEGGGAEIRMPLLLKALYGIGVVRDAAEKINHRRGPDAHVAPAPTAAYGAYLIRMCVGCHREDLSGGPIDGAPPDWPPATRLAPGPGSVMPRYDTREKFAAMIRSGKRPDGTAVNTVMPFATLRNLNDTDLDAIYAYIASFRPGGAPGR